MKKGEQIRQGGDKRGSWKRDIEIRNIQKDEMMFYATLRAKINKHQQWEREREWESKVKEGLKDKRRERKEKANKKRNMNQWKKESSRLWKRIRKVKEGLKDKGREKEGNRIGELGRRKQNEKEKAKNENKENLEGRIKINLRRSTSDRNEKYSILSK